MVAKKGLGKGIDSMIPNRTEKIIRKSTSGSNNSVEENVSRETFININEIEPNKMQPRKKFDEDMLQELAESIKHVGIIQPLLLKKKGKYYEIIAGERRWRAARIAGLKEVPALIKDYSDQETMEISIIENIQREDLNPIEEAYAYQKLIEEFHLKQDEVAERVCKSRAAITNTIRLLKLDEKVQQLIMDDIISSGHGRSLLSITDKDLQYTLAMNILDEKLSVRETEKMIKRVLADKEKGKQEDKKEINKNESVEFIYHDLEEKMKRIMGTKVNIKRKSNNKGFIEIEYYSEDELDRLVDMIVAVQK